LILKSAISLAKERVKPSPEETMIAKKITEREKQIDTSKAKILRIDSQMETLRLQFEARMRALEDEKNKSERYVNDTEEELQRLQERENALKQPRVRISQTDYTKLRTLKQVRLEQLSSSIDKWYNTVQRHDNRLKEALEAYYGTDFHKIMEVDLLSDFGPSLVKELTNSFGEIDQDFSCIANIWDYTKIYNELRSKLDVKINDVNRLINNSEIP
jgi:chromosome segregation ATPase